MPHPAGVSFVSQPESASTAKTEMLLVAMFGAYAKRPEGCMNSFSGPCSAPPVTTKPRRTSAPVATSSAKIEIVSSLELTEYRKRGGATTVSVSAKCAAPPALAAATSYVRRGAGALGVPEIAPVAASKTKPEGSAGTIVKWSTCPSTVGVKGVSGTCEIALSSLPGYARFEGGEMGAGPALPPPPPPPHAGSTPRRRRSRARGWILME